MSNKTYADFSGCNSRITYAFGQDAAPWGLVSWQPRKSNVPFQPLLTVAQFFDPALNPTSGELMEIRDDGWVYNTGFRNPDGVTGTRIRTVKEIYSDHTGQHDITVPGGPQHYALWVVPDHEYGIWSKGQFVDHTGKAFAEFSHSQQWFLPELRLNPFWKGDGEVRLAVRHHEEWYDDGDGRWAMRHCRMDWMALGAGTIWYVEDELYGVDYGMQYSWTY